MLFLPFVFMLVMIYLASAKTWAVCGLMLAVGMIAHCFMEVSRRRGWVGFNDMIDVRLLDGMRGEDGERDVEEVEDAAKLLRNIS